MTNNKNGQKMKQKNSTIMMLAALALTACTNDEAVTTQTDENRVALNVSSDIRTRAYDDTWEAGDCIGIFAFEQRTTTVADSYANIPYVTQTGGTFAPDGTIIYLPTDDTQRDFVAYYPYTTTLTNNVYIIDVSDQSEQAAIDLMAAGTQTASRTNPNVAFTFTHKLSKVEITLAAGTGMTESDLEGLTVELTGQQTAATFDVTQPTSAVSVTTGMVMPVTLLTNAQGTSAEGIVLPSDSYEDMSLDITLTDGTSKFSWSLSNATQSTKFEEGKKYLYTITVNKSDISVTATITDWIPGNSGGETGDAY